MRSGDHLRTLSDDVHFQATLLRGWDQDYVQLQAGRFQGSVNTFGNGPVKLFSERMNCSTFQMGALPEGHLAFGLPIRAAGYSLICGEEGDRNSLLVFSGRSGFEFRAPGDFEFLGIEIAPEGASDPVFRALTRTLAGNLASGRRAIRLDSRSAGKFGRQLRTVLAGDAVRDMLDDEDRALAFNRGLVGWILDMLPSQTAAPDRQPVRHWEAIMDIRRLVSDSPLCPLSVAELTEETGLSRRTLQSACQQTVGLSPVQYLRALRLSEARRALGRSGSVTEAATQYGFWHLGYFARDYRAMFGELPSETLLRRRLA